MWLRYYIALRLAGACHQTSAAYANNMTRATQQRKRLEAYRRQRRESVSDPFQ